MPLIVAMTGVGGTLVATFIAQWFGHLNIQTTLKHQSKQAEGADARTWRKSQVEPLGLGSN